VARPLPRSHRGAPRDLRRSGTRLNEPEPDRDLHAEFCRIHLVRLLDQNDPERVVRSQRARELFERGQANRRGACRPVTTGRWRPSGLGIEQRGGGIPALRQVGRHQGLRLDSGIRTRSGQRTMVAGSHGAAAELVRECYARPQEEYSMYCAAVHPNWVRARGGNMSSRLWTSTIRVASSALVVVAASLMILSAVQSTYGLPSATGLSAGLHPAPPTNGGQPPPGGYGTNNSTFAPCPSPCGPAPPWWGPPHLS
jgi:hypothetical protein